MSGTKFYKLIKSNEVSSRELIYMLETSNDNFTRGLIEPFIQIGGMIISTFISFFLSTDINNILIKIPVFFGSCVLLHFFYYRILEASLNRYRKKSQIHSKRLVDYFYQKCVNNLTTALSLEKRITEILENPNNQNIIDEIEKNLAQIYIIEALYYFDLFIREIDDKYIIEIYNTDNDKYTEYLALINPDAVRKILDNTKESLTRLKNSLEYLNFSEEDYKRQINRIDIRIKRLSRYQNDIIEQVKRTNI